MWEEIIGQERQTKLEEGKQMGEDWEGSGCTGDLERCNRRKDGLRGGIQKEASKQERFDVFDAVHFRRAVYFLKLTLRFWGVNTIRFTENKESITTTKADNN